MTSTASLDFSAFFNVIDGKLSGTARTTNSINPSTLEENPPFPVSTVEDVNQAVEAAGRAASSWAQQSWPTRKEALTAFANALEVLSEDFVSILVREQGKPLGLARHEVSEALRLLRGFATTSLPDETIETNAEPYRKVFTRYVPLGVVVGIVPWNYPVYIAAGKLAQAIVTGNTFILKPSPFTSYSGLKLAELAQRFFPPGVVQGLVGDDSLGPLLTAHPGVHKVSFTGSTATGKLVMKSCSETFKRLTLELGGNDAAIICADVDPEVVGPKVALLCLANSGQICIAIKRVYVHESIHAAVLLSMVKFIESLKIGDGFGENVTLGPVTNKLQFDRVRELLADIENRNFKLATGSVQLLETAGKGYFISPTVVDNPPDDSQIVVEEPFGPVFPVLKWSDEAEVIKRANNTDSGLGASIWTQDLDQADRISKRLMAGNIWINTHGELQFNAAFAGHKSSGFGVANGTEGLKAFCNPQTVYVTKLN